MLSNLSNLPVPNRQNLVQNGKIWSWEMLEFLMICRFQRPSLFTWSRLAQLFTGWHFNIVYDAIEVEKMFDYLCTNKPADFKKFKELIILDVETLSEAARVIHKHITQPWRDYRFESERFGQTISFLVIFPLSHVSHSISIDDVLPIFQFNFASQIFPGHNWTTESLLQLHQFLLDVNDYPELGITLKSEIDRMDPSMQIHVADDIRKLAAMSAKGLGGEEFRRAEEEAKWDISKTMTSYIRVMRRSVSRREYSI